MLWSWPQGLLALRPPGKGIVTSQIQPPPWSGLAPPALSQKAIHRWQPLMLGMEVSGEPRTVAARARLRAAVVGHAKCRCCLFRVCTFLKRF